MLEGGFKIGKIIRREEMSNWTAHISKRPRNITLRKGMLSSLWTDVEMVSARNMDIMDSSRVSVPAADCLRCVADPDREPIAEAVRWALMLTEYGRFLLQLQALPGAALTLSTASRLSKLKSSNSIYLWNIPLPLNNARSFFSCKALL